ncbi:MAG: ABC transporter substrate-binding protein [Clostridia bacterium]|nr:ABC transporter substrate-binding protein [Clostridia bacterium]
MRRLKTIVSLLLVFVLAAAPFCGVVSFAEGEQYTLGDLTGDGKVKSADARIALRIAARLETAEKDSPEFKAADVDGDGKIKSSDARMILRVAAKLESFGPQDPPSEEKTVNVGTGEMTGNFSPFFSDNAYDEDVISLVAEPLLSGDPYGKIVEKGIGNGGIADVTVTQNADGSVDYDFTLADGVKFSDGKPLTVDDVIFSMYVLSDPLYDGTRVFSTLPVEGMAEYRERVCSLLDAIAVAGRDNTDHTMFTADRQAAFWASYDAAVPALAEEIVGFCREQGYGDSVSECAAAWGFDVPADGDIGDLADALEETYGGDIGTMILYESAGSSVTDLFPDYYDYAYTPLATGKGADHISGIVKTGENSLRVHMTEFNATSLYHFCFYVAPLHWYGDEAIFDYENHRFGFDEGDMASLHAKDAEPLGAGPYALKRFENGVASFEANGYFYRGAPKIKNLNVIDFGNKNGVTELLNGNLDIVSPVWVDVNVNAVREANGGGLTGGKIVTYEVDTLGYGYVGISANAVKVGRDPGSDASKALRKAFATVLARYREESVDHYYGDIADVIEYPISDTSWAAPRPGDEGYRAAFSTDAGGSDIYTPGMTEEQKDAAALQAALGFFRAAGCVVENGYVVSAPAGASRTYDVYAPGDGRGDHPLYRMFTRAAAALKTIGVTLNVIDVQNGQDMFDLIVQDRAPMWCAAWGSTVDPDMYQVYYSGVESGLQPGGSNYMYDVADAELDRLILDARASADNEYRKGVYKKCLDIILDWAVEIPAYQRKSVVLFSAERINTDTLPRFVTPYYGWIHEIENLEMN